MTAAVFLFLFINFPNLIIALTCSENGLNIPHSENCKTYFDCSTRKPFHYSCPGPYFFDLVTLACSTYSDGRCAYSENRFRANPNDCSTYFVTKDSDGHQIESYLEACTKNHFNPENQTCDSSSAASCYECRKDGKFPRPPSCKNYYLCTRGKPYLLTCSYGKYFNLTSMDCDSDRDGMCIPPTAPISSICDSSRDELVPNLLDCGSYYRCSRGKSTLEYCPHYQRFDQALRKCNENTDCVQISCSEDGLQSNPLNSQSYYQCYNGYANLQTCPNSTHFNGATRKCEATEANECSSTTPLVD